ncbi:MAG: hypothetical protein ACO29Y_05850 [Holophagaceae bacterium]
MTYTSYEVQFWNEDFKEPETYPVHLTDWELTRLMKVLERNGDSQLELYRKLARATRLTW